MIPNSSRGGVRVLVLAMLVAAGLATGALAQTRRTLDDFADLTPWKAAASDGVKAVVGSTSDAAGPALRLDFDFGGVSGWAAARRALPLDLPENYELSFWLHGKAPANTLEVKLADDSGQNVWWRRFPDLAFPAERREVVIRKRQIEFAWGPAADKTLRRAGSLEFVVSRGAGGGKGAIWIDHLTLRALPPPPDSPPPLKASSPSPGAQAAVDGSLATVWTAPGGERSITLDLGLVREFGGLTLTWAPGAEASRYAVSLSDDAASWRTVREVVAIHGGRQDLRLPDTAARYVRLDLHGGPGPAYRLEEATVQTLAFGASQTAFLEAVAKTAPRGVFPRAFSGEQAYWTLLGVDGGARNGLISEDGAIELGKGGVSVEPFVVGDGRLVTWADATLSQSLKDGYLPIPSVRWRRHGWTLNVTAFATGAAGSPELAARYELRNLTARPKTLTLLLAVRPFQVNGPEQFLNSPGGFSPIHDIGWTGGQVVVNGRPRLRPLKGPDRFAAATFDTGLLPQALPPAAGGRAAAHDEDGLASGALVYRLRLPPRGIVTVAWTAPLGDAAAHGGSLSDLDRQEAAVAQAWRSRLGQVAFTGPPQAQAVLDTLKTSLADMLISRDGPELRPGTRSYDRSWIRDGAMISEALLRLGDTAAASDYLRWYAPHQFANGKAPCCVDARGADPTPENDSQGELIYLAAEVYRYGGDKALLRAMWPHAAAAAGYMDELRQSEHGDGPAGQVTRGLMPASISHEGYSSKPAYSYWDDFWALRGYDDAVFIAGALGETAAKARLTVSREAFRRDLYASLAASVASHAIGYIPGAADLGDFDATSTTIALAPGGQLAALPPDLLHGTFERYWREFVARRDRDAAWDAYTPYELRAVGAFTRLGRRDRADALLDFFMKDRRPPAWNGWAEVVGREARKPRFIGDMPHAWVASDYVRSVLDMFAYERESDHALVLGAGLPPAWFAGRGVGVRNLSTPYGKLRWSARISASQGLVLRIAGARPPGGYAFAWPLPGRPGAARFNGRAVAWKDGALALPGPGRVVIDRP
jgi:hypothetical protein